MSQSNNKLDGPNRFRAFVAAGWHLDLSDAAKMLNVSERSLASAVKVLAQSEAELVRAVELSRIKVRAAKAKKLGAELQALAIITRALAAGSMDAHESTSDDGGAL